MRSDALQNRERILDITVELILEVGGVPTRDAIAERAGVGIGTLYRHFPDRQSLLHAVARHALEGAIAAGEAIVATPADSAHAVRQYLHAAIDHGIGVVNMIHPSLDEPDWPDLQQRAGAVLTTLIERNHRDHQLRPDLSVGDIVFATIRFGRPLAIGLPLAEDREIAHRQLDRYVDGLRAHRSSLRRSRSTTRS
jgi:AcrR family transcriptional regulator